MNKFFSSISRMACLLLVSAVSILPASANYNTTSYTLSGKQLTKWVGNESEIDFNTDDVLKTVTSIGAYAFQGCQVKSLTLNEGLTEIGRCAFMDCHNLVDVNLPSTLQVLQGAAFSSCESIETIDLPQSLISIGNSCFYQCTALSSVTFPDNLTEIPYAAFNGCESLTDIKFGKSINVIGEEAFLYCTGLKEITFPESLEEIGVSAFSDCTSLEKVTFNPALEVIGNKAFENTAIKTLDMSNLTMIDDIGIEAFSQCRAMTKLELPAHQPTFRSGVFSYCNGLSEIIIPDSYTEVGVKMFYCCSGLERVVLGKSVETIKNTAFFSCSALKEIVWNENLSMIDWNVFFECNSLVDVTLPESLTSIDDFVFNSCASLKSITLGSKIEAIGREAFSMNPALEEFTIKTTVPPVLGSYVFYQTDVDKCVLNVPAGSVEAYGKADQWKDFTHINSISSVASISGDAGVNVSTSGNTLSVVIVGKEASVTVSDMTGKTVAAASNVSGNWNVSLTHGTYIVTVGSHSIKVIM